MIDGDGMTEEFHATVNVQLLVTGSLEDVENVSTKVFKTKKVLMIMNTHPVELFNNSVDSKALLEAIGNYMNNPQE